MFKLITAGLAVAFGGLLASAPVPTAPTPDGAIVIRDIGCGLFDGGGNPVFTSSTQAVITSSGNGMLRCQAQVDNPTGKAVRYDFESTGALCGTPAGVTDKWHETVSASGQATLSCHVNGND